MILLWGKTTNDKYLDHSRSSKTTRLLLFSISGVSLFVLSLILYPENLLNSMILEFLAGFLDESGGC